MAAADVVAQERRHVPVTLLGSEHVSSLSLTYLIDVLTDATCLSNLPVHADPAQMLTSASSESYVDDDDFCLNRVRFFHRQPIHTPRFKWALFNAPYHANKFRNVDAGCSLSQTAIFHISATAFEHIMQPKSLFKDNILAAFSHGVRRIVFALDHQEEAHWNADTFQSQSAQLIALATKVGLGKERVLVVPISRINGVNISSGDQIFTPEPAEQIDDAFLDLFGDDEVAPAPPRAPVDPAIVQKWSAAMTAARAQFCPWYEGPSLIDAIEQLQSVPLSIQGGIEADRAFIAQMNQRPFIMSVLTSYQIGGKVVLEGRVLQGTLRVNEEVSLQLAGVQTTALSIRRFMDPVASVSTNEFVTVQIDFSDKSRIIAGELLTHARSGDLRIPAELSPPAAALDDEKKAENNHNNNENTVAVGMVESIEVQLVVTGSVPSEIKVGFKPILCGHGAQVAAKITHILRTVEKRTGATIESNPKCLKSGDCAVVKLQALYPLAATPYSALPPLGRFLLRDNCRVVGACAVKHIDLVNQCSFDQMRERQVLNRVQHRGVGRASPVQAQRNQPQQRGPAWANVPITAEAQAMAARFDFDDFVDVRAPNGKWHAAQVLNKQGVLFHAQYMDGIRNGEEELHMALTHHRVRLASLGTFTTAEAAENFPLAEGDRVEVQLTAGAMNGEPKSGFELNSWVTGSVIRVDGMQVEVEYGDGQYSAWFNFVQKEIRQIKVVNEAEAAARAAADAATNFIPMTSFGLDLPTRVHVTDLHERPDLPFKLPSYYTSDSANWLQSISASSLVSYRNFPFPVIRSSFNFFPLANCQVSESSAKAAAAPTSSAKLPFSALGPAAGSKSPSKSGRALDDSKAASSAKSSSKPSSRRPSAASQHQEEVIKAIAAEASAVADLAATKQIAEAEFIAALKSLIKLRHPNIARVYSHVSDEPFPSPTPAEVDSKPSSASSASKAPSRLSQIKLGGPKSGSNKPVAADKKKAAASASSASSSNSPTTSSHDPIFVAATELCSLGALSDQLYSTLDRPFAVPSGVVESNSRSSSSSDDAVPVSKPMLARVASESGSFSLRARLAVAIGLTSALRYLHGSGRSHGDVRSSTVLLEGYECKLSVMDSQPAFEPVRSVLRDHHMLAPEFKPALAWRAPELMVTNAKSDASSAQSSAAGDIWSLALVILELFSGNNITKDTKSSAAADNAALVDRVPWYGLDESAIIDAAVVQRRPPPQLLSAALPEELRALLTHCLAADPSARPSASEVLSALLALSRMYPALEANDREAFQRYHTEVSTSGITLDRTIQLMQLSGSAAEDFAHAHAEAAEEVECVVCLDALATHQCSPCGHRCVCAGCSILAMATCPFCREPIQKLERVAK